MKDSMSTKRASIANTGEKKYRSRSRYGTIIEKLVAGDFFGHDALSQRDEASLHSIFADEPLELLAVGAEIFSKVLLQPFQDNFRSKAEFLSGIRFFSGWSPHLLRQLIFTLKEKKYHPGECIFRQDVQTHCFYFIKCGSIKLSTHCSRKAPNEILQKIEPERDFLGEILAEGQPSPAKESAPVSTVFNSLSRVSIVSELSDMKGRRESKMSLTLPSLSRRGSLAPTALLNTAKKTTKQSKQKPKPSEVPVHLLGFKLQAPCPDSVTEMCHLGPGELLGDIEATCGLKHHLFNAVCVTTTVVYEVDLFHIEQLLHKKAPRTFYSLLQHIVQKVEAWHLRHKSVQFFDPLMTLLNQLDKKLSVEGANKPVRRQHNYDAPTLALMATRSLGKPVLSTNFKTSTHKGDASDLEEEAVNCRPFSSLYGNCSNPSPVNVPVEGHQLMSDDYRMPEREEKATAVNKRPKSHHSDRSAGSRIITSKTFTFNSPPPRQYSSKPNPFSSARFPIPTPSPYPVTDDQTQLQPSMKQRVKESKRDDKIETVMLQPLSPLHGNKDKPRCKSAHVNRVCQKPTLPIRPSSACSISRSKATPGSSVEDPPVEEITQDDTDQLASRLNRNPPVNLQGRRKCKVTAASPAFEVPIATTSEGDVRKIECNVVSETSKMTREDNNRDCDSSCEAELRTNLEREDSTRIKANDTIISTVDGHVHQKQVRISDKVELLGPTQQPTSASEAIVIPTEAFVNNALQPTTVTEFKSQYMKGNVEMYKLDGLETTIPLEYHHLQQSKRPNSSPLYPGDYSVNPDCADGAESRRCRSAMASSGSVQMCRMHEDHSVTFCPPSVYKCINMSYYAAHVNNQTR